MRKYTFFFLTLSILIYSRYDGFGQTGNQINDENAPKGWEVGLDLLGLIDKNSMPATSLFAKYNIGNTNTNKSALRIRVGFDFLNQDSVRLASKLNRKPSEEELNIISGFLRLGYEWEKIITKKYSFFYAIDASFSKLNFKSELTSRINEEGTVRKTEDASWGLGAIPVIGFKYMLSKRVAISIESSLNFVYMNRKRNVTEEMLSTPNQIVDLPEENIDLKEFSTTLIPISVINFSYIF